MGLKASSAYRWVNCPGSYSLCADIPAMPMGDAAIKGIEEHGIAARVLSGDNFPDGTVIPDAVSTYTKDVFDVTNKPIVEQKRQLQLATGVTLNCYIDAYHYDAASNTWYVWDYKSGHNPVDAVGNWQLVLYALALLSSCPQLEGSINFELRIVQPRISGKSVWKIPAINLRSYRNIATSAALEAISETPSTCTGNHCHYCPALSVCFSAQEMAKISASYKSYALKSDRSIDQISSDLIVLKEAKASIDRSILALEEIVAGNIRSGKPVPGWTLGSGRGSQVWAGEDENIRALAKLYGVNVDNTSLITPKQAIKAGLPKNVVNACSKTTAGKAKLILAPDYSDVFKENK